MPHNRQYLDSRQESQDPITTPRSGLRTTSAPVTSAAPPGVHDPLPQEFPGPPLGLLQHQESKTITIIVNQPPEEPQETVSHQKSGLFKYQLPSINPESRFHFPRPSPGIHDHQRTITSTAPPETPEVQNHHQEDHHQDEPCQESGVESVDHQDSGPSTPLIHQDHHQVHQEPSLSSVHPGPVHHQD